MTEREKAKHWLIANVTRWPRANELAHGIVSDPIFKGWGFVKALDENIYFADCIHVGISETEFRFPELVRRNSMGEIWR